MVKKLKKIDQKRYEKKEKGKMENCGNISIPMGAYRNRDESIYETVDPLPPSPFYFVDTREGFCESPPPLAAPIEHDELVFFFRSAPKPAVPSYFIVSNDASAKTAGLKLDDKLFILFHAL